MSEQIISLKNLCKVFYTEEVETHALTDISFSIRRGEYVSITGSSGCGKSTLLSILGLLDISTSGEYLLTGQDTRKLSRAERARLRNQKIGFVFQSFNLLSELTVAENVALPLTYRTDFSKAERKKAVETVLERVDMTSRRNHYPSQLSGGQQQRVAVARALVGNPSIILADEPTGNLDSKNASAVMDLLGELHRDGATICMVTHDPRSAEEADRTIFMNDGRIVAEPSVEQAEASYSGVA